MSKIGMNKSQLRKLAREYAVGRIDEQTYRERRRTLVDDIVSGRVAIVREAPPPLPSSYSEDPTTKVSIGGGGEGARLSPIFIALGAIVVVAIIWLFVPLGPDGTGQQAGSGSGAASRMPDISRARVLIDDFVEEKDFSEFSIASFKESWSHLTYSEKQDAYTSHWFNDLINLISDEIKTQNALLDSANSGTAVATGERLEAFADFLGVSENVTDFKGAPEPAAASTPAPATTAAAEPPEAVVPETDTSDAGMPEPPQAATASEPKTNATPAGRDTGWLAQQPKDAYTLQLFAVNQLDKIEALISANPDVDLEVLTSEITQPRYRIVYGTFVSAEAARRAHAALPDSIRQSQPDPLVKTVGSLRREMQAGNWVAGLDASQFTLQVMATDDADNARRLMANYPAVELNLLDTTHLTSRYRVLYGAYDSEASAKAAVATLPAQLLEATGDPLVKPVSELQAVKR